MPISCFQACITLSAQYSLFCNARYLHWLLHHYQLRLSALEAAFLLRTKTMTQIH